VIDYGEVEGLGYQRKWHCDRAHVVPSLTVVTAELNSLNRTIIFT
jgi:hypothetical protein